MPLTTSEFARFAAATAKRASASAAEALMLPEALREPIDEYTVGEFVKMLRKTADHLERRGEK